jgi:hypothetical protein
MSPGILKEAAIRHILYEEGIQRRKSMKKIMLVLLVVAFGFAGYSCESIGGMSDTTKGAAVGAGVGAIAGQIIGGNTAGTLIGAAVGTLGGALVGHEMDYQKQKNVNQQNQQNQQRAVAAPDNQEAPPGQWIQVPGQWVNGKWVPAHRAWVPVNP